MNKLLLVFFITALSCCFCTVITAQSDSSYANRPDSTQAKISPQAAAGEDDEFNMFLLFVGTAFVCTMIGAAIVGSFAAAAAVLFTIAVVSVGILSASVFTGIYKRSVGAGLKTLVMIVCTIAGSIIGSAGLLIVTKIADIHIAGKTAVLTGAVGGLMGGLLMGLIIYRICRAFLSYIKGKLRMA